MAKAKGGVGVAFRLFSVIWLAIAISGLSIAIGVLWLTVLSPTVDTGFVALANRYGVPLNRY